MDNLFSFGSHIKNLGKTECIVGHDNRLSSPSLYKALIEGIKSTGINVISLGLCTTPMYYYACIKLKIYSGVMVTASHNSWEMNGIKIFNSLGYKCDKVEEQEIEKFIDNPLTTQVLAK